jgi:hypothetical protein|tara:strand:- start:3307 stop:3681 length:375 start_codon:yes stop_codon:yes gene_type:complete
MDAYNQTADPRLASPRVPSRDKDVDRFKGTPWEGAVEVLRKEAFASFESDGHGQFDTLLKMYSNSMRIAISSHEQAITKLPQRTTEKMRVRVSLLKRFSAFAGKVGKSSRRGDTEEAFPKTTAP